VGHLNRMGLRQRIARAAIRALFRILFRPRLVGAPPRDGPYLMVANHQGWADGFLLSAFLPAEPRVVLLGDRDGTMGICWHRAILRTIGLVIPIDRTTRSDRSAIDAALASLAEGCALVVFAEGQVSHAENALVPFRRGVGYLALRAGVPVVPVWLSGTAELYLGRELAVTVGQPREVVGKPTKEATLAVARTLHADVAALAPQEGPRAPARKRWVWLTNLF